MIYKKSSLQHHILDKPYSTEYLWDRYTSKGFVMANLLISQSSFQQGGEELLDLISDRITNDEYGLENIFYSIIGFDLETGQLVVEVIGDLSAEIFEDWLYDLEMYLAQ